MTTHALKAENRKETGKKVKKLRKAGVIPGNVYGKNIKSFAVKIQNYDFAKVYEEAGETGIIDLSVGKQKHPVLVADVQVSPVNNDFLHIDFKKINLKEKVSASVPVVLIGESPAEKSGLGTVVQQINEVQVEALPGDLPEEIEADTSMLTEVDSAILVKDLKYNKNKVEILLDLNSIVAKVEPPQEEKEEVQEAPEEEAPEQETPQEEAKSEEKSVEETEQSS